MQCVSAPVSPGAHLTPFALRLGLAVSLSGGLYAAGVSFSPFASPLLFLVPLPGLVLATDAPAACVLWLLLTEGVVSVVLGVDAAASLLLLFGLPACSMASGFRRGWAVERTVLAGMVAWSAGLLCSTFLAYGDLTVLADMVRQQLAHGVDLALSTYGSVGVSDSSLAAVKAERDLVVTGLIEVLPALVMLCGALMMIANLVLLRRWTDTLHDVDLRLWRTPDALIWALIATGFSMFLPVRPVALVARNIFIVLLGCYFCQGLAIVSYFLERFRLPRGVRVAGYLLIAVQHIVAGIVLALGVFDLWGNFRRLSVGPADIQIPGDGE
jgi:uncharacterized protein YybS (DUF2232 family)